MDSLEYTYNRGFYLTDDNHIPIPFGIAPVWRMIELPNGLSVYCHKNTSLYYQTKYGQTVFLLGHAYNPYRLIADENKIVGEISEAKSQQEIIRFVNELTGIFVLGVISDNELTLYGDPAGMQCVFYGMFNGHIHIASHTQMFEEVCRVRMDPYVSELIQYRFYPLFGRQLPGDLTPYREFKRMIPNHCVHFGSKIIVERFFPDSDYLEYSMEQASAAEREIGRLLHNNLELIAEKWEKPAISLTGGCDSKTTLACANGLYDRFSYFSYDSSDTEKVDADAAHEICSELGLKHTAYWISRSDNDFQDIEETREILNKNNGSIGKTNSNDVRKRAFFAEKKDFDVEVKSWVSECGRAYYCKRFAKTRFPKDPTPHYLTTLYKVFFHNRKLVHETDRIFGDYLSRYLSDGLHGYPWQELFFWEFRMSAWNGLVITGEHRFSYEITIPYNNRYLIDMLLHMPLKNRIEDTAYQNIREQMNPEIDRTGISVTNVKHTEKRAKLERLYLDIMSKIQ